MATDLRSSLVELDNYRSPWFPEILSLFLQLSDRPVLQSQRDQIVTQKPVQVEESLSWREVDLAGAAYCDEEDIWEDVDFRAGSSEDDISSESSEISVPRILPQDSIALDEEYVIPDEVFMPGEDGGVLVTIKDIQFWNPENNTALSHKGNYSRPVTELQIVRETIFMLQGLPTSLFRRSGDSVEVNRTYALAHSSNEALSYLLQSFSAIGTQVGILRKFITVPQTIAYVQSFVRGIEDLLRKFDAFLSKAQTQYLTPRSTVAVSLLELLEVVRRESRVLLSLVGLVSTISHDVQTQSVRCLDLLYDLVCMTQAVGNDNEFQSLAELFFFCFKSYIRPIRLWMETGQLDSVEETFFILEDHKDRDLRTLWHDWYTLDEASRLPNAPKFLHQVARKIFTTGKSMVFLRHLEAIPTDIDRLSKSTLTFEDLYPQHSSSSFALPFSVQLESSFEKLIDANHSITSDWLQAALDQQCGLWTSLQALDYIYLGKDMGITGNIDNKIFESIDRGKDAWNDRFLLTELAQHAFSALPLIDPSRVIVRSSKVSPQDLDVQNKSVKMLNVLSFDYILPWPVANIITRDAISTYQRISTFLMQIRRAQHVIVKQRLQYSSNSAEKNSDRTHNVLGYAVRHSMLWFLNTLYGHIVDVVISTTTTAMRKELSSSKDTDAMIAVHRAYISSMEDQCLLSRNLVPLHEAIINTLDLCVRFADMQAVCYGDNQHDQSRSNKLSRKQHNENQSDSDSDFNENEDEDDDPDQGNTTRTVSAGTPYPQQIRSLKNEFDRSVGFLTAGLKSVGRVDGQPSWEILAEKLEWRKEREAF